MSGCQFLSEDESIGRLGTAKMGWAFEAGMALQCVDGVGAYTQGLRCQDEERRAVCS